MSEIQFEIEKTVCRYNLYDENINISKNKYEIIITPLHVNLVFLMIIFSKSKNI